MRYTVVEIVRNTGFARTTVNKHIQRGKLKAIVGSLSKGHPCYVVEHEELVRWARAQSDMLGGIPDPAPWLMELGVKRAYTYDPNQGRRVRTDTKVLTTGGVARLLGVAPSTASNWVRDGLLRGRKRESGTRVRVFEWEVLRSDLVEFVADRVMRGAEYPRAREEFMREVYEVVCELGGVGIRPEQKPKPEPEPKPEPQPTTVGVWRKPGAKPWDKPVGVENLKDGEIFAIQGYRITRENIAEFTRTLSESDLHTMTSFNITMAAAVDMVKQGIVELIICFVYRNTGLKWQVEGLTIRNNHLDEVMRRASYVRTV